MKPSKPDIDVQSTFRGEEIGLSFDEDSVSHLMSVLTDLYSDPIYAVVREYSTNAHDSHIESGVERPIEITLPSEYHPTFKVRDYGTGLSLEEIRDVYSKYGASTKRGTNTQIGILGLGCKSALTYTNQFVVTSVKDSMKTVCSVSRDEEGSGKITVVHEQEDPHTPQGVEISVPVKGSTAIQQFRETSEWFFSFWPTGSVLVNRETPNTESFTYISDTVAIITSDKSRSRKPIVVMGNVPYTIEGGDFSDRTVFGTSDLVRAGYSVVFWLDIGEVDFVPSREQLHYTNKTKNTIQTLVGSLKPTVSDYIDKQLENSCDEQEAMRKSIELKNIFQTRNLLNTFQFRGVLIPDTIKTHDTHFLVSDGTSIFNAKPTNSIQVDFLKNTIIVPNFSAGSVTKTHLDKLDAYLTDGSSSYRYILFTRESDVQKIKDYFAPWFSSFNIIDWKEVPPLPRSKNPNKGVNTKDGKYECYTSTSSFTLKDAEEINKYGSVMYVNTLDEASGFRSELELDDVLVVVGKNRVNKFKRLVTKAEHAHDARIKRERNWYSSLSEEEKAGLAVKWFHSISLEGFSNTRFDKDPDVVQIRKAMSNQKRKVSTTDPMVTSDLQERAEHLRSVYDRVLDKYPLLRSRGPADSEHIDAYLNSIYQLRKEAR